MASPLLWSREHQVQGSKFHTMKIICMHHCFARLCSACMVSCMQWTKCAEVSPPVPCAHLWCHAAGFIATELVSQLLAKGYEVRGTVRDPNNQAKVAHLVQLGQVRNF